MSTNLTEYIAFKATAADREKLEMLARQTGRTASSVLRLFIRQAVVGKLDLELRPDLQSQVEQVGHD